LLTFLVKDTFVKQPKKEVKAASTYKLPAGLKVRISTLVAIQLTNIPDALLLLQLHQIGFSAKGVVASYMLFSAVSALLAYPAGAFSDKLNPRIVYAIGLLFFSCGYITLGLTQNHILAVIAIVLYGVFPALTDGVGKAWIASMSPPEHRGRIQGVYQSSMNFAILGAGIWGGATWTSNGIQWPLVIAGSGALMGSLILVTIRPQQVQP
jgi:MFS family permease